MYFMLSFYFSCYVHHQDLHSFPTRRSSDLTFAEIEAFAACCRFTNCTHGREPGCAVQAAIQTGALDLGRLENWRKVQRELDRKSTRLNSSHVAISYAVFCLKKKKKKNI